MLSVTFTILAPGAPLVYATALEGPGYEHRR